MRAVTLSKTIGGGKLSWTADLDTAVSGFVANVACLLSRDSADSVASFQAPPADNSGVSVIAYSPGGTQQAGLAGIKIPIVAGEVVTISFSAAGSAVIYLDT